MEVDSRPSNEGAKLIWRSRAFFSGVLLGPALLLARVLGVQLPPQPSGLPTALPWQEHGATSGEWRKKCCVIMTRLPSPQEKPQLTKLKFMDCIACRGPLWLLSEFHIVLWRGRSTGHAEIHPRGEAESEQENAKLLPMIHKLYISTELENRSPNLT